MSVTAADDEAREDLLRAYVTTYLSEEIRAEGLVRNLGSFSRFLEVAALAAGQRTNVSNIARDAAVSRETARGYFDVLVDTLIGAWLPSYRPRAKVKEVAQPKFYWFDPGVLHAAAGGFDQPLPSDWQGVLLEHLSCTNCAVTSTTRASKARSDTGPRRAAARSISSGGGESAWWPSR